MKLSSKRGQSMVELALVAPLFLLLVLGLMEGARAVWYSTTLAEVAQEGSRFAIVHSGASCDAGFKTAVENAAKARATNVAPTVTVTCPDGAPEVGSKVDVVTTTRFTPLFGIIPWPQITLSGHSRMTVVY